MQEIQDRESLYAAISDAVQDAVGGVAKTLLSQLQKQLRSNATHEMWYTETVQVPHYHESAELRLERWERSLTQGATVLTINCFQHGESIHMEQSVLPYYMSQGQAIRETIRRANLLRDEYERMAGRPSAPNQQS